jgi:acetylornithine deacetylase/succinyl-diaminopimelate desuccinylase family protein
METPQQEPQRPVTEQDRTILEQIVKAAVASSREQMVDLTRELIAIPTANPPGTAYRRAVQAIEGRLVDLGLDATVIEVPATTGEGGPGREQERDPGYCLLSFFGPGERTLYFHGHYDVVPAQSEDQYQPFMEDGRLYGRGSADMKGGLAAMIYAVAALRDCRIPLNGRIGLVTVPDEETGGERGSRYLADAGLLGKDGIGMLTPEPTSGVIWNANRGALTLRITVKGKHAHVGLQYQGVNAFEGMIEVANALLRLKGGVEQRSSGYGLEPATARRSILMLGGRCEGGTNFNAVPALCWFTVDRRINPEEDLETERAQLLELLEGLRNSGIDLAVEVLQEAPSAGSPKDSPLGQALTRSIEVVTGQPATFELCPGLLETRFYARQGMPAYAYGPGLLPLAHGPNEFVTVQDMVNCAATYALTAADLLGAAPS